MFKATASIVELLESVPALHSRLPRLALTVRPIPPGAPPGRDLLRSRFFVASSPASRAGDANAPDSYLGREMRSLVKRRKSGEGVWVYCWFPDTTARYRRSRPEPSPCPLSASPGILSRLREAISTELLAGSLAVPPRRGERERWAGATIISLALGRAGRGAFVIALRR